MKEHRIAENETVENDSIPHAIEVLKFGRNFNKPLNAGIIPDGVKSLAFGRHFDQPLEIGVIPNSVKSLKFGRNFNQPLRMGVIPIGVESLTFGMYFNHPLGAGVIPNSVKSIKFGMYFNHPLGAGVIPDGVAHLFFGWNFRKDLTHLPETIETIEISVKFKSKINFPLKLRTLTVFDMCMKPITNHPLLDLFKKDRRILSYRERCLIIEHPIDSKYLSFIIRKL